MKHLHGQVITLLWFCAANAAEPWELDAESEAMVEDQGLCLLQAHFQLQGNAQLLENNTNGTSDAPLHAGNSGDPPPIYTPGKFPMAEGDSWPAMSVMVIELIAVFLLLAWGPLDLMGRLRQSDTPPSKSLVIDRLGVPIIPSTPRGITWLPLGADSEPRLLHHRISRIAASAPQRLALIDGDHRETFGELQASALFVARHLVEERSVKPCSRTPIGVCAEGVCLMHGILGIVQTGNPYVPMPSSLPATQRDFIMSDSKVEVVLADPSSLLPGGAFAGLEKKNGGPASPAHVLVLNHLADGWRPTWQVTEVDLAYVLYTSGTTGNPKGVLAPHSAYYNRLKWMWEAYPFAEGEVGIQSTAIEWIDHVQEVFGFLGAGVPLVLAPPETRIHPIKMINLCSEHSVSRLVLVPSLVRVIVGAFGQNLANELPSLRFWLCSGEPFPTEVLEGLLKCAAPGSRVLNTYGTTEVAGDVTWAEYDAGAELPSGRTVPIGKPIPPNVIHLLNPTTLQPVPTGEIGEIFIEGPHLAVGYHNSPAENRERFVEIPALGISRTFRTGDFGKLGFDNMIQFAGRTDQQVKVHGQRIEVLQVECVLNDALLETSPEGSAGFIPRSAVMAVPSELDPGSYRLIAFVEPVDAKGNHCTLDEKKLCQIMRESLLPAHVPESIVAITELPRLASGKPDRMALKQMAIDQAGTKQAKIVNEMDSFGQIRRILVEYIDGRRVVGTMTTFCLIVVIVNRWVIHDNMMQFNVGVDVPRWAQCIVLMMDSINEGALFISGLAALHGMGDHTKFEFSWWEPSFLLIWFLVHQLCRDFLPPEGYIGYLFFLPVFFCGRLWAILWHKMLQLCDAQASRSTDVFSVGLAAGLWVLRRTRGLGWLQIFTNQGVSYIGSGEYVAVYLFGFYFVPVFVKKASKLRSPLGFLLGLSLFAGPTVLFYNAFTNANTPFQFTTSPFNESALGDGFTLFLVFAHITFAVAFFASLPEAINLTLAGPAQFGTYILHMFFLPCAMHGAVVFGLRVFPSLPDILQLLWNWPRVCGACQVVAVYMYAVAFVALVAGFTFFLTGAVQGVATQAKKFAYVSV